MVINFAWWIIKLFLSLKWSAGFNYNAEGKFSKDDSSFETRRPLGFLSLHSHDGASHPWHLGDGDGGTLFDSHKVPVIKPCPFYLKGEKAPQILGKKAGWTQTGDRFVSEGRRFRMGRPWHLNIVLSIVRHLVLAIFVAVRGMDSPSDWKCLALVSKNIFTVRPAIYRCCWCCCCCLFLPTSGQMEKRQPNALNVKGPSPR